ncbi:hypothetical protein GGR52DRAFT_92025 [Hypoxylon sp. FL1284]|nr:hypothetical protein GGR52DRAFT_92025 [Hypoxylon sp. FL1284]
MLYPNMTTTAMFLSCTPPPTYTTLSPVTQTMHTTVYETVLAAACETSQWMTTYTVTETYTGSPAIYTTPTIPQGFVVTTVVCPACKTTEIEVTQPAVSTPTVTIMTSNGVTTVTTTPTAAPSMASSAAYPTGTKETGSTLTAVPATSGYMSSQPSYAVPSSCSGSACSTAVSVVTSRPGSSCSSSGCNSTTTAPPAAVVTAGAPPLKGALELFPALALLAGHFFLL